MTMSIAFALSQMQGHINRVSRMPTVSAGELGDEQANLLERIIRLNTDFIKLCDEMGESADATPEAVHVVGIVSGRIMQHYQTLLGGYELLKSSRPANVDTINDAIRTLRGFREMMPTALAEHCGLPMSYWGTDA